MQHYHFSRVDQVGIDQMGIDKMGVDQVGINHLIIDHLTEYNQILTFSSTDTVVRLLFYYLITSM